MNYLKPLTLLLLLFVYRTAVAQPTVSFPLRLSDNKRYLIDSLNKPFLIKEFSAWGWIQTLSEADASAFLDEVFD